MSADKENKNIKSLSFKLGVALLIIACLLWVGAVVIPFLPLTTIVKAGAVTAVLVAGEVAFWVGALLTGKEFVAKYKKYLDPRGWKK